MYQSPYSTKGRCAGWLVSTFLLCTGYYASAHNLDEAASRMSSKGQVPIGGTFTLSNAEGKSVTQKTFAGKWELIFFGFTTCSDVCSTVMSDVAVAMADLGSDASRVQPIFITMDPARDTAQRLSEYLSSFDSRIVGLHGTQAQTNAAIKAFHVYSKQRQLAGNEYTVDHSAMLYLMKPDGSFGKLLSGEAAGHKLTNELRAALQ